MFWNKKKKAESNQPVVLPTKDEAHILACEEFNMILNGCIQAMAKEIRSQIRKGFFSVEWDCMVYCGHEQEMHIQNVRRNENIRLALCKHLENSGYIVLWDEGKQLLTVKW